MNKYVLTSLITPIFLIGCGASEDSSSSKIINTKFQWQIVQLKSMLETSLDNKCIIFADSALNAGEVITAYIADQNFNIIYHNEDGSIASTFASDEFDSGLVSITENEIPDNGYVTLEETSESRGGDKGSYMFSVQKSLMSDLVLNISQEQTDTCYTGDDYRELKTDTLVNVSQPVSGPNYYQSSYDEEAVSGQSTSSNIPVYSSYPSTKDILVTAFTDYDETLDQSTGLTHWVFVDSNDVFLEGDTDGGAITTVSMSDDVTEVYWSTSDNIILNSESRVIAVHDGSSYFWQPIYDDNDLLALSYGSDEISLWSSYFSGTETINNWLFNSFITLTEGDTNINLPLLSLANSVNDISVVTTCSVAAYHCLDIDSSYSNDDFDYQRVHIRLTEDDGDSNSNITYQSIYSTVNEEPVVLASSLFSYTAPTLIRTELNLMNSDLASADAAKFLMVENIDLVSVGEYGSNTVDDGAEIALYNDINGFVFNTDESDNLYLEALNSNTTILMNSVELAE